MWRLATRSMALPIATCSMAPKHLSNSLALLANAAGVSHFVYVSVAHSAPMMKAYIDVRSQCEDALAESGLNCTILRPWYVLGPGHSWPYLLIPFYKIAEVWPSTRASARRLGLVTLPQMVNALAQSVDSPPTGIRILEVPEIKTV
jgi:uncharacterized protein YbjT (DUF2867 family)